MHDFDDKNYADYTREMRRNWNCKSDKRKKKNRELFVQSENNT